MASRTLPRLKQVVLNDVFTQALNQAKQKPVQLTHNQEVSAAHCSTLIGYRDDWKSRREQYIPCYRSNLVLVNDHDVLFLIVRESR